jgi:uncharacterized protein (DUF2342 family)
MSDANDPGNLFNDLLGLLGQQGPDAWFTTAQQLAINVARGTDGDPNPPVDARQRLETFAPLVERRVEATLGVVVTGSPEATTRTALTLAALDQWRPLLAPRAALTPTLGPDSGDLPPALLQLTGALGPLFLGFQMGSVAGHFSERAWSLATLSLPRVNDRRLVAVGNVAAFASEWSLDPDAVMAFALARETLSAVILSQPATGDALRALLLDTVAEAAAAQNDLFGRLSSLDASAADSMSLLAQPEQWLDGLVIPEDSTATLALNAATATLGAYVDSTALTITEALVGPQPALREAYRRFRLTDARGEDAAGALFGLALRGGVHDEATRFIEAILDDADGVSALFRVDGLPKSHELGNPAAWRERVRHSPLA